MKPNLGQNVYVFYETFLVCDTVEMLGKDSFATSDMFSSLTRDEYRHPIMFNDYGDTWFTSLSDAKKKIIEQNGNVKIKKVSHDDWVVYDEDEA